MHTKGPDGPGAAARCSLPSAAGGLAGLGPDILCCIFDRLEPRDVVACQGVCTSFRAVLCEPALSWTVWRDAVASFFDLSEPFPTSVLEEFTGWSHDEEAWLRKHRPDKAPRTRREVLDSYEVSRATFEQCYPGRWGDDVEDDGETWLHGGDYQPAKAPVERRFCLRNILPSAISRLHPHPSKVKDLSSAEPYWNTIPPDQWRGTFYDLMIIRGLSLALPLFLKEKSTMLMSADKWSGGYELDGENLTYPVCLDWPRPPTGRLPFSATEFIERITEQLPAILDHFGLPGEILADHYTAVPLLKGNLRNFSIAMFRMVHHLTSRVEYYRRWRIEDFGRLEPANREKLDANSFWMSKEFKEPAADGRKLDQMLRACSQVPPPVFNRKDVAKVEEAKQVTEGEETEGEETEGEETEENEEDEEDDNPWYFREFALDEEPLRPEEFVKCCMDALRLSESCFGEAMVMIEEKGSRLRHCAKLPHLVLGLNPISGRLVGAIQHYTREVTYFDSG
jgi:hypothetical protein